MPRGGRRSPHRGLKPSTLSRRASEASLGTGHLVANHKAFELVDYYQDLSKNNVIRDPCIKVMYKVTGDTAPKFAVITLFLVFCYSGGL